MYSYFKYIQMMKSLLPVLLLILSLNSSAQKTEQLYDYDWKPTVDPGRARYYTSIEWKDSLWERRDFFIREKKLQMLGSYKDKETKIPEGQFYYYHSNGQIESAGKYANGKKNGLWLSFHDNGMMYDSTFYDNGSITGTSMKWYKNGFLSDSSVYNSDGSGLYVSWFDNGNPSAAGIFSAGRKENGKWQYFHRNGNISSIEIYNNGNLASKQYFDEKGGAVNDTTSHDHEASFPGGLEAWKKYLLKKLFFPSNWEITGSDRVIITVDWTIDEDGKITDAFISSPVHPQLDKLALDIIMKSPKWIPAISHNRAVKNFRRQPLTFVQEQ
jgi:hypothetical protein